jgi:hypothetical protein
VRPKRNDRQKQTGQGAGKPQPALTTTQPNHEVEIITMRKLLFLTVFIILGVHIPLMVTFAEQKIPVEVAATAEDMIGKQLVFKIKEEIRKGLLKSQKIIRYPGLNYVLLH